MGRRRMQLRALQSSGGRARRPPMPSYCGRQSAVLLDEGQHAPPSVIAGLLPLFVRPVEEAVRSALVDVHLVRDTDLGQLAVEVDELFPWRGGVGARDKQKQRRL